MADALIVRKGISKPEEEKTVSSPDFSSGNIVVTPTAGKVMTQVTVVKDTTNHVAGNIKSGVTLYGVEGTLESGVSSGFTVRFIDYDGTVLKEEVVASGEDATPPTEPSHTGLTFQEWNVSYTNVTENRNIGASYVTDDGKTRLYIRLTTVTGLSPTLYFNKSTTFTLKISWGDGSADTENTSSGNISVNHTYSAAGEYVITVWISSGSGTYYLGNGSSTLTCVGGSTQAYRNTLHDVEIGSNVTVIQIGTFRYCYSLRTVSIPAEVGGTIGSYAFQYCYVLMCAVLPNGITSIGDDCFGYDYGLIHVVMTTTITSIGNYSFRYTGLKRLIITEGVTTINSYAFSYSMVEYIQFPATLTSLPTGRQFEYCYALDNVHFPSGISGSDISASMFQYCYGLKNFSCDGVITYINDNSFGNCFSLESLGQSLESVTYIASDSFCNNYSKKEYIFGTGLTEIRGNVFSNNYGCIKYVFPRTAGVVSLYNTSSFTGINAACKIYVPDALVASYKAATNWVTYANYIYPMSEM